MKKIGGFLASGLIGAVLAFSSSCTVLVERKITYAYPRLIMRVSWESVNKDTQPQTLEEIAEYQKTFIGPAYEIFHDEWKSAKRTHEEGYGDCEDYAINAAYFAEKLGYEPIIMIFKPDKFQTGHAVALFKKKENEEIKYRYMDSSVCSASYSSLDDLANDLSKKYINRGVIKHPWTEHRVINLNSIKCDWRNGKGNLKKYFEKYVGKNKD